MEAARWERFAGVKDNATTKKEDSIPETKN